MLPNCKVAIVGAGPHGLAVAAHLSAAGVEVRVHGEVMEFWRRSMPVGMLLRSERAGSHIADPRCALTLERYEGALGRSLPLRMPLDDFVAYGMWYQKSAVPQVDNRRVARIEGEGGRLALVLDDGEVVQAERVVVATGLAGFASRPLAFADVSAALAPHACEVRDPSSYAGLDIAVIGAGQSALELAALLHEAGANVEVLVRRPQACFLSGRKWLYDSRIRKLLYPPGELGPPGINWIIELPDLFRSLPAALQRRVAGQVGPVGAAWLRPRLADVPLTTGRAVATAAEVGGRVRLVLDDGTERVVDRAVLATGYRVDLDRSPILAPSLVRALRRIDGSPWLTSGFESSVPGLYFIGAAAAASFGPLMRFVAGTGYAARTVTRHITGSRRAGIARRRLAPYPQSRRAT